MMANKFVSHIADSSLVVASNTAVEISTLAIEFCEV